MIYTCTMNLAIDLYIQTKNMNPSEVNRTETADYQPNGKGVNVSFILKQLGLDNTALGFSAGFTGEFIKQELLKKDIHVNFVPIDGINRINVFTQVTSQNQEYKLVNQGPSVSPEQEQQLLQIIQSFTQDDILFVSGSHPQGITKATYQAIGEASQKNGFKWILDTSAPFVLDLLAYKPYLIKPNDEELAEWFHLTEPTLEDIIHCGHDLLERGAQNILISLGGSGALFMNAETHIHVSAPKGEVVNTACAGDTLLATFVGSALLGSSTQEALIKAVAAGSSTAFRPGLTDFSDVEKLAQQIKVLS